jgi:hypothetical protein
MLLEVLKVINWFNPFVYLLQRSIKTVHEYIADEQTAAYERDALTYSSFLLNNAYGIQGSTIAHSFFNYNLLKKRIIMLNKNRSGKLARLKYLTVHTALRGNALCINPADIDYIKKTMKLTVEVIDVDSQTKMPVAVAKDAKSDTTRKLPPPPPPGKPKKAPKVALRISGKKLPPPPPPVIVLDAPATPASPATISIDEPTAPMVVLDKPIKVKKVRPVVAPKIAVAPVVAADVRNLDITIDSPVVVTDTKISIKPMKVKPVTKVNLKKVDVKTAPVIKLNLKIDTAGTKKP